MTAATEPVTFGALTRHETPAGAEVFYRDSDHSYWQAVAERRGEWRGAGRVPGISGIGKALGGGDPSGLMRWAARENGRGVAQLSRELDPLALAEALESHETIWDALTARGLTYEDLRDRRATEGSNVHERIFAALGRGEPVNLADLAEGERGFGRAAARFWYEEDPEPLAVERVIYDPGIGVAGRIDLLGRDRSGAVRLWDAKTSTADPGSTFVNVAHHAQASGYAATLAAAGYPAPERATLIYLYPDGSYRPEEVEATAADFVVALAAYRASSEIGKRVRRARREGAS
jgi:PD-(D/E)XK nuclease superfamily